MNETLREAIQQAGGAEAEHATWQAVRWGAVLLARRLCLPAEALNDSRLGGHEAAPSQKLCAGVEEFVSAGLGMLEGPGAAEQHSRLCAHLLGKLLDELMALRMRLEGAAPGSPSLRRRSGSFFTPPALSALVAERALHPLLSSGHPKTARCFEKLTICDPAAGGGAFLIECCALLAREYLARGEAPSRARLLASEQLRGVDRSKLAVATSEAALWLYVAEPQAPPNRWTSQLRFGDALSGAVWFRDEAPVLPDDAVQFDWPAAFPEVAQTGFDLVIGNPPWVAYAGRSAQALSPAWRSYFRGHFQAFAGFPALHGLFVERAASLAPRGRVALLLPSPLADLDGYRATRRTLTKTHEVREPLMELGQDVFEGVVQPCFVLVADARGVAPTEPREGSNEPWQLVERSKARVDLVYEPPPAVLKKLDELPCLPSAVFRELGFQTNRQVTAELLQRGIYAKEPFSLPLLEGRNVREFVQESPRLFLWADEQRLKRAECRLRSPSEYRKVDFVVRQTASITIAARHGGHVFRNSLLAGYAVAEFDAGLLVALLNSSLFRALHLSRQRDARQAAFPQVKIAHLRRLPAPPPLELPRAQLRRVTERATELGGCPDVLRTELDCATAQLFGLGVEDRQAVERFVAGRLRPSQIVRHAPEELCENIKEASWSRGGSNP